MDDFSSPDSSEVSVFDAASSTDAQQRDDDTSPFSNSNSGHSKSSDFGNGETRAVANSRSANNQLIAPFPTTSGSNAKLDPAPHVGADATTGQRKRRAKRKGEKKDAQSSAATAGSDGANGTATNASGKIIKRRAARACVSCRNRKVRCDVVETFPCGNCRWDKIECVVQEGRRRRRGLLNAREATGAVLGAPSFHSHSGSFSLPNGFGSVSGPSQSPVDPLPDFDRNVRLTSPPAQTHATNSNPMILPKTAVTTGQANANSATAPFAVPTFPLLPINRLLGDPRQQVSSLLPAFIRPPPAKMAPEDIVCLHSKGAFTLPDETLQRALLHAYVEFVHPYMPLLELQPFLKTISGRGGEHGTVSLLLYHAVMFTAASFVPAKYLKAVGFSRRREARKTFFMKARVLYDFDYETDRLTLVQALLLMTYWYETPDDQKDTWHWMGVAVSLAHTIGLHRDPRTTGETPSRQRLRKLLWWCCFMRDRMIALGMRRPKRIRSEDADVPMLTTADFDIAVLPIDIDAVPPECRLLRDVAMQEELAELCIEKAKLCVLVGGMLQQQYTILPRGRQRSMDAGRGSNTMMLFPNRTADDDENGNGPSSVDRIDAKLRAWLLALPLSCRYAALTPADVQNGRTTIAVQRTLLHLVYHTTMSALHRPRIQPAVGGAPMLSMEQQEFSRNRVRDAADCVTRMGSELLRLRLEPYLPTSGVTVFLPAIFAHLLDIKGGVARERRQQAVLGFITCMRIMESLRDTYAAAEIATGFVESLLKKAGIDLAAIVSVVDDGSSGGGGLMSGGAGVDSAVGTGTSTPVNGTSASLLQATANVGVPYTEDGVAHAVAMYVTNKTKSLSTRTTPPAEDIKVDDYGNANGQAPGMVNNDNTNTASSVAAHHDTVNMMPQNFQAVNHVMQASPTSNPNPSAFGNTAATSNATLHANGNGAEHIWSLTPSASAVSEDPFEWDVTAVDPNSMKLDFDQWLDFPPEGMGSSTDHAFAGLFTRSFGFDMMNTDL